MPVRFLSLCLLLFNIQLTPTFADLLISPTRVEFANRDRSARISLVNTSQKRTTYRLYWKEQAQLPDGQYAPLKDNQRIKGVSKLSRIIRFSPSQITLDPGERQHIRLAVRRPNNMEDGEYRSHLVFSPIPDPEAIADTDDNTEGAKMKITLNLSFAIPIILRQGEVSVDAKVTDVHFSQHATNEGTVYGVTTTIARTGVNSSLGDIKVYWKPDGNQNEVQIATTTNFAIYSETPRRFISLPVPLIKKPQGGQIRVEYVGIESYKGRVFDSFTKQIKASDYQLETDK